MNWKIYDESVEMMERRFGFFPRVFCWHGRCYRVQSVDRSWEISRWRWRRRMERRYFQVECAGGTFELYQDLKTGTWHLRRARLGPARVSVARQTAPAWR